ncbi:anti-sigma factor domain-containing protein [Antrihabitans sp. YC2-6]|uniref:anti-sigma factor n=1 Tax=Antrihabitans sp. YC2-6 TaxID=2799498 RepID=UPI0018F2CF86|nr:anti-sigma factor [Antrihabitans sp. YC2-6]MBJ8347432.1 anti-sigma factor [Antrihabitans sp. YC2-6]
MNEAHLDLANAYALGILEDDEQRAVRALRNGSDTSARAEFENAVRQARETLATVSLLTVATPPPGLLERVLAQILDEGAAGATLSPLQATPVDDLAERRNAKSRWRWALGAAAAVAVLAGGTVIGNQLRETNQTSVAESIVAAPDLQTVRVTLPEGGSATALYSKDADAAIVMMVDVPPAGPDSVYQMWLIAGTEQPKSAGLLPDLAPTTTAVLTDLDNASTLAFSVEPTGGSEQPTTTPFAVLTLA